MAKNPTAQRWDELREDRVRGQGRRAALAGEGYGTNPYLRMSRDHLLWSQGHNGARVELALLRDRLAL